MILQNERGSEWSEGDFGFLTSTTADAQDTLDWISAQEWSNGKVGLHGCSSTAENQLKLGAIGHPALRACVPMSSGAGDRRHPGRGGLAGLLLPRRRSHDQDLGAVARARSGSGSGRSCPPTPRATSWPGSSAGTRSACRTSAARSTPRRSIRRRWQAPSGDILRRMGSPLTGFETFMADGPASPAWKAVDLIDASHTGATPSININGWMDVGAYETVKLFEFQQHHPDQYLIMAPTEHCQMLVTGAGRQARRPAGGRHQVPLRRDHHLAGSTGSCCDEARRLEADAEGAGVPDGRGHLADRRVLAAARDRDARRCT